MADERSPPSPWPALVVLGVLCGISLGALVVLIFRDRQPKPQPLTGLGPLGPNLFDWPRPVYAPALPSLGDPNVSPTHDSKVASITVGDDAVRTVFQAANNRPWLVQVSVIDPPCQFAFFSTDPVIDGDATHVPPNAMVCPTGEKRDLYLQPGEILYVRGSAPSTVVSYQARSL